ncbi:unnamed protein product [Rotaria sordida]|uniref:Alpha/beta hydrolase fold-3 domain-containing protein n=1 Tax=Rotaria sordida TaxID=392033 RepID=A0A814R6D3_9BILA|nr:unnamed protein product [Rotaria sordida]
MKRDSRFTDEANAYCQLAVSILPSSESPTIKEVREADEKLFTKGNEKLIGTFKGTLQEEHVKVNCAEIPITIYIPIDVNRDKLVIFFHGGGWTSSSRKTHQTMVNTLADDPMYILTPATLDWLKLHAFHDANDLKDPRVSVLLNKSFNTLPPCLFIAAELDPLRDDSYAYQELLDKAGVKTKLLLVKGVLHDFLAFPGTYPKACTQAVDVIQQFVSEL